jgi:murein hydrolase activator
MISHRTYYASMKQVIYLLIMLFCISNLLFSQEKEKLEQKKKQLEEDIKYKDKLLKETTNSRQHTMTQLVLINKKIEAREELIGTIRSQIYLLGKQIDNNQALITAMEQDLKQLKKEYAAMIYNAYKNRGSYAKLMFIFAASDFNQAYNRLKYYQQYSEYRQNQAKLIMKTQESINSKIAELEEKKKQHQQLLNSETSEKKNLLSEKDNQQSTFKVLQKKESELKNEIKRQQQAASALQKEIERIIREEMAKMKKAGNIALTPEAKELMSKFEKNKGILPWPVEKGLITGRFGKQAHAVLKNIEIENDGVIISTTSGASVRAVFEGTVSKIIVIPNSGKAVLVRHGEYVTVYNKLKDTSVNPGDNVTTKQVIGTILTDEINGKTEVEFQIYKGQVKLNPSEWLYEAK